MSEAELSKFVRSGGCHSNLHEVRLGLTLIVLSVDFGGDSPERCTVGS